MCRKGVCDIVAGQISYCIESYRFFLFYAISFIEETPSKYLNQ